MSPTTIGPFPNYLSSVESLLGTAMSGSEIDIYVDGPDHGSLAKLPLHLKVHEALRAAKARGAKVRLLLPAKLAIVSRANPDYNDGTLLPRIMTTPGFRELSQAQPSVPEAETFDQVPFQIDAYMRLRLVDFSDDVAFLPEKEEGPTVFLWRVDGSVIYVSLPKKQNTPGEAFSTSDPSEVGLLIDMFNRYWQGATKPDDLPPCSAGLIIPD